MAMESAMFQAANDAHDDAKDVAMTAWQHKHDEEMQERQFDMNQRLNSQMAGLARQARQESALDQVVGLRAAGLNPALAQGGSFGSVSSGGSVSAPSSGSSSTPHGNLGGLALESIRYAESERNLMAAQARKLNADAVNTEIENSNRQGENFVSEQVLRSELEHIQSNSPEYSSEFMWSSALLKAEHFNAGHLRGFMAAMDAVPKVTEANYLEVANKLAKMYSDVKLTALQGDNEQARRRRDLLANVDAEQARQIRETTDNIAANTMLLVAEMARTDKNVELIDKQKAYIDKQMELLGTQIRATHHSDLIAMYEDGEYMNTALGFAFQVAPGMIQGATTAGTFGLAQRFANGAKRSAKSVPQVPQNETVHEQWRYNKNGQPTSYKRSRMSGLSE